MWLTERALHGCAAPSPEPVLRSHEKGFICGLVAVSPGADEDHQEKCLSQLYDRMPEGLTPLATLRNGHQRQQLGACSSPAPSLPMPAGPAHGQPQRGPQGLESRVS